jgi:hypothetical protein
MDDMNHELLYWVIINVKYAYPNSIRVDNVSFRVFSMRSMKVDVMPRSIMKISFKILNRIWCKSTLRVLREQDLRHVPVKVDRMMHSERRF